MKVHEGMRQHWPLSSRKSVAIFVYSYELDNQDEQYDQIYSVLNRAMRNRQADVVEFFHPLIWELDQALAALPAFSGLVYRGIDCRLPPHMYERGSTISWAAFSSASQDKEIAKEFTKAENGTLFLVTSTGAKSIERISQFPDEVEVLFAPNAAFRVTETLIADTALGSFYTTQDNIVMCQYEGRWGETAPELASLTSDSQTEGPLTVELAS